MRNKLAFISSPYAAVFEAINDSQKAREIALDLARNGGKMAARDGFVPFSPVLSFDGIFSETQRDEIMQKCFDAICESSVFYCVKSEFFERSTGMQEELKFAKNLAIPVYEIWADTPKNSQKARKM